uniref:tRNA (guanosine(18)-2'-O)-methyltransferase TARBP1 n=1 Tax=Setaria italica TaxID=4555 RepID=K4A4R6_SETIT
MASPPERTVAALESCFRALPADAVPAVVDCVLASSASTSPAQLFHALLRSPASSEVGWLWLFAAALFYPISIHIQRIYGSSFPPKQQQQGLQAQSDRHASISHAAALRHLLARFDNRPKAKDAMRLLLWRVFLPLLRDTIEPNLHQVVAFMCDAISDTGSWDLLGATIVPFCIRSSVVAMGLSAGHDSMLYHSITEADFAGDSLAPMLTLSKASSVLASLLRDILERRRTVLSVGPLNSQEVAVDLDALVQNLTWDLSTLVFKMFAHGQEYRSCATRTLLQPLLISLADIPCVTVMLGAVQHKLSRFGFLERIWDSCISLFSLGRGERLDAYNVLSLYLSTLKLGHQVAILGADKLQEFDLSNVSEFWNQLRKGLVDKDSFVRKQAFYVLTISLSIFTSSSLNDGNHHCSSKRLAALPAQTKSNTATTKRERWASKEAKSLGVRQTDQSDERCSNGQGRWKVFLLLYEMLQEYGTHLVEAAWMHQVMLLFESTPQTDYLNHTSHGAFHAQMESWEGILHWMTVLWERGFTHDNPQVRCLVMQSFLDISWEHYKVCAQIIPRGFVLGSLIRGLNDVVHHKDFGVVGIYDSKTIKGAESFFSTYAQNLTRRDRIHLVWSLASAAKHDSFGRAGLMTLASCVASCTCQSDINDVPCATPWKEPSKCDGDVPTEVRSEDLLDALWILSERSKQHFNPKYRLKVCEQVIKVATSLINAAEVPLNQLLHFISTIPREFTDYFGPLRVIVQEWFVQKKECSPGNTLLSKLLDFPTTFVKHSKQDQGSNLFDDEDVNAWEAEARRWARTLLLVTSDEQHLKRILGFIEAHGYKLSQQSPVGDCVPIKFFIILLSFIEELEARQKKLETMVVFSKLSCSVFWLKNIENMDLPYSVKGKLGGPSQRRLATSITSSVLQGIWSMRCISSVASWCNHYNSGDSFFPTFSFLWDFYWKVIEHSTNATETGAELHLAAYEALAYVLEALSTARNSQYLDLVETEQTNQARKFSLDISVTTFLNNINRLLTDGILTRSRRAVLMTWKTMMQLAKSSWILHLSCNKRRVAPIAALLSAILHPAIFCKLEMHQTNEEGPGPLKWFIENLLNEGSKSPRTIRLAALHLSGLWLMYPETLRFYMDELKQLSLYGSVAFDEDFEAELSENHEAKFEVSMLAQSPDREFTEVFINTELYARVSVAVLFHQLWKQIKEKNISGTEEALQSGKLFLLKLLDSAVNDKDLSKELYKKYSSVHRRKVRVWQMICVLSHYVEDDIVGEVILSTHTCLYRNNLPAVRQYLETFAILLYLKFPTLAKEQLIPIFHDKGMRQQALSSYVFIVANVILHSRQLSVQRNHLNQLLPPILPFLTSHHHSLRCFTQLLVHSVLSRLWPTLYLETSEDVIFERRCFQELKDYLAENSDCVRLRVSIEGFLDVFDPNASGTPSGIFSTRPEVSEFECVPVSVMERVIEFLNDVREDLRHAMAKDTVTIKNEGLAVEGHGDEDKSGEKVSVLLQPGCQDALDFQKKITPRRDSEQALNLNARDHSRLISGMQTVPCCSFLSPTYIVTCLSPVLIAEIEEDDQLFNLALEARLHAAETIKQSQQELIVVASLVDRIPNLAGLTRTCEVFRAAGLVVADKSILLDKQFQLISVTAEKWLPITELPVDSVKAYLERKRAQGYSVIGLEQTAHSRPLDRFEFPRRTVLVLGREKEGIPVDIIHILDACVEIPQLGVVRSLNVHVSGAIAVWEYTRQHSQQPRPSSGVLTLLNADATS